MSHILTELILPLQKFCGVQIGAPRQKLLLGPISHLVNAVFRRSLLHLVQHVDFLQVFREDVEPLQRLRRRQILPAILVAERLELHEVPLQLLLGRKRDAIQPAGFTAGTTRDERESQNEHGNHYCESEGV